MNFLSPCFIALVNQRKFCSLEMRYRRAVLAFIAHFTISRHFVMRVLAHTIRDSTQREWRASKNDTLRGKGHRFPNT